MELVIGIVIILGLTVLAAVISIAIAVHSTRPWRKIKPKDIDKYYDLSGRGKRRRKGE